MTHKGRVQVKTAMMLSIIFCLVLLGAFFAQADIYLDNSPSEFIVEDVAHVIVFGSFMVNTPCSEA